jgi:hypothetical protein
VEHAVHLRAPLGELPREAFAKQLHEAAVAALAGAGQDVGEHALLRGGVFERQGFEE